MRSLLRALGMSAALALLTMPALAQDDEAPAAESAPSAADRAARRAARKAELRAWHAKQKALREAREAKEKAAAEKAAAEAEAAPAVAEKPAVEAPAAEQPAADKGRALDAGRLDSGAVDTLPAVGASHAIAAAAHGQPAATAGHGHAAAEHAAEPEAAHGGGHGGGHEGFSVGTFVLQVINFAALLFILIYFGGRAMAKALRAKHEQLKGEIGEAARLRDEAQQKLAAQDRRMAELEKEIAALRASMREDAEREQARLVESAQARGRKIQEDMRVQIDEQVKIAEAALRAEVANASVAMAEEIIRKAVSFEDERRLAREFVAGFARPGTPSPDEEVR